jgi:hypothetical protein
MLKIVQNSPAISTPFVATRAACIRCVFWRPSCVAGEALRGVCLAAAIGAPSAPQIRRIARGSCADWCAQSPIMRPVNMLAPAGGSHGKL